MKHIDNGKLSHNTSELTAVIHCAARSAFTVETYSIAQTDYDYQDGYDDRSEHNDYGQSKSTYHVNQIGLQ